MSQTTMSQEIELDMLVLISTTNRFLENILLAGKVDRSNLFEFV